MREENKKTRRLGDTETREDGRPGKPGRPCLRVPASPCPRVSQSPPSPRLRVFLFSSLVRVLTLVVS